MYAILIRAITNKKEHMYIKMFFKKFILNTSIECPLKVECKCLLLNLVFITLTRIFYI